MPTDIPDQFLKLPTANGKAPETRMESAEDLRKLLNKCLDEGKGRSVQRTLVRGNLDGHPPYGNRKRKGEAWVSNVNFGGGRGRLRAAAQPYHALFSGVEQYAVCRTAYQKGNPDNQRWSDLISQHFHAMIKRWGGFEWHMQQRIREMLTEGWAPMIRDGEDDWRYRAVKASAIHVPRRTPSTLDERCTTVLVQVPYTTTQLYGFLSASKDRGWNETAVRWWIRNAAKSQELKTAPWEEWQRLFQHHAISTGEVDCDLVYCTQGLVQEYGKPGEKNISHFIISDSKPLPINGIDADKSNEKDFLFKHVRRYYSYDDCLVVFFGDIGDGEWASVRGLAMEYFKHDVLNNRLMSRLADTLFVENGLLLSTQTQGDQDKLQQVTFGGGVTILPAGAQVEQSRLGGSIQGLIEGSRFFQNDLSQNLGNGGSRTTRPEYAGGEKPTAFQVSQEVQATNALSQDKMALDFISIDKLLHGMFKVAAQANTSDAEAKRFQEDCAGDGVPKEALRDMECVYANRTAGYGSAQMRQIVSKELLAVAGMMPEEGKNNLLNDHIVATTQNPSSALRYNPAQERLMADDALIVLENAAIKAGEMPIIFSGQRHVKHIQGHLQDTAETLAPAHEAVEAGNRDPQMLMTAVSYLEIMAPHLEQHIAGIENDPSRMQLVKQFRLELKILTNFDGQLRQEIRAAQAEAQQQAMEEQNANALGILDQKKAELMDADKERKDTKAAGDQRLKTYKATSDQGRKTWQAQQDAALKTASTLHELELKQAKNGNEE